MPREASVFITPPVPQQGHFRRHSAAQTTTTDVSAADAQSFSTLDQLLTARASVDMQDKLWTQIDVLDDVKAMAEEVDRTGGFFNAEFAASLAGLKGSQAKLIEVVSRHQAMSDRAREQRRHHAREHADVVSVDDDGISQHQERTKRRMHEFFAGTAGLLLENTQLRDFDELDEYVLEVRRSLGDVGEKMTHFDEVTKKLW